MQAVSENMKTKMFGRIVNISSIWGSVGKDKRCSYSSSKFGIRGLTVSAAAELAKFNILVNTVSPGFTLTDLTKQSLSSREMVEICSKIPMMRMAETHEISSPIVFLSSRANSYISGQNIIVDGGYSSV
jgi:3-oxoacyl-[acyl-carrier protein] reductase